MEESGLPKEDKIIFDEIQVLLAEKRTALSSLRTGAFLCAECAHRDVALLQLRQGDAFAGAAAGPELWTGRPRCLADLPFYSPHSPFRAADPRAQPKISGNRAVHRVAPANLL